MGDQKPTNHRGDRSVVQLVEAIIDDIRDLVGAHVEALRDEMSSRFSTLGTTIASTLLAFSIMIVTALLVGIAFALTLVALGLPAWAAFWIVAAIAGLAGIGLVRYAQRKARETGIMRSNAVDSVKDDIAWISDHTHDAETKKLTSEDKTS